MTTQRRATLIYNPHAGFDDWLQNIKATVAFWRSHGWEVSLRETGRPSHATELAGEAVRNGHQLVLAAGGDGTIHEVANGLLGTQTILATLPAGTTNCFARDLGLPSPNGANPYWLIETSERQMAGTVQTIDVGECSNGRSFILWAAVGVDSRIVESVEPRSRLLKRFGIAGYFAKATLPFLLYQGEEVRVGVDDVVLEDEVLDVIVANSRLYAGGLFNLSPRSMLDDGLFDVWILRGRYSPQMLAHSLRIMTGRHIGRSDILHLTGRRIVIETKRPQPFHLDGELHRATPVEITLEPSFLHVLAPQDAPKDLFVRSGTPLKQAIEDGCVEHDF
ncbi:MAG: diacylglycerol kinase family lipid kinase [Caldilinea sp.]|nr:diacylglycerol kinase family lipid kinase [Caldilinea sp.]MDW8442563.1 diacylglycerol kinase family lipid kinase [Caldilineaceae bacterium]